MALIIPALTANLEATEITKAIDPCTCAQLRQWREKKGRMPESNGKFIVCEPDND
jgi:hypothetical protein